MKDGIYLVPPVGLPGMVDATSIQPNGDQTVRVGDKWWFADACRGGPQSGAQSEIKTTR